MEKEVEIIFRKIREADAKSSLHSGVFMTVFGYRFVEEAPTHSDAEVRDKSLNDSYFRSDLTNLFEVKEEKEKKIFVHFCIGS